MIKEKILAKLDIYIYIFNSRLTLIICHTNTLFQKKMYKEKNLSMELRFKNKIQNVLEIIK